ncbi:MAG: chorismate synthase [Candidatus Cloacimonetes bacterium]|nr:chorismate synthase [Candidatus Cloacimonadota bacterium]
MKSNSLAKYLGFTCFGESHGKAMGIVIEDIKPNIEFPYEAINNALQKRRPNTKYGSQRREEDVFHVLSGVYEGKTTGLPICILVYNKDIKSKDYDKIKELFRPGHADFSWYKKFKIIDWRGGGRASGRETISRVIAGAIIDEYIKPIEIDLYPIKIGQINANKLDKSYANTNPMQWADNSNYDELIAYLDDIQAQGDSVGAVVYGEIKNITAGLGDPVFDKLDANLAKAIMSIGAIKGIEFGDGFALASMLGSEANDQMNSNGFLTNHQGGILGGVSTGSSICFKIAIKPVPSISKPQKTVNINNNETEIEIIGRHDTCLIPRILPVIESMIKLCLADAIAYQKLIEGENQSLIDYREAIDKIDEDILLALVRRMKISEQIGIYKKQAHLAIENKEREQELFNALESKASLLGLEKEFVKSIWTKIIAESKRHQ